MPNFQCDLPNVLGLSQLVRLVNLTTNEIPLGFTAASDPDSYPGSQVPAAPSSGLGFVAVNGILIDSTGNNSRNRYLWIAPAACRVNAIRFIASVLEATSATTTVMPQRVPSGQTIGGGGAFNLLAAALNVKTGLTANQSASPALNATAANLIFAAGDGLALNWANPPVTEFIGTVAIHFALL